MKYLISFLVLFLFTVQGNSQTLHIYGGNNHDVYLGCLNCNKYDSNSIWNRHGTYGSKYNSNSIWNRHGNYGGAYSDNSPFNRYASHPPVIVDKSGNFYGYLTVNTMASKRANSNLANVIYKYYEKIRDDVSEWYDIIFN